MWREHLQRGRRLVRYGAERFKEPSSWNGIGGFLLLFGIHADPGLVQGLTYIGAGACWFLGYVLREGAGNDA